MKQRGIYIIKSVILICMVLFIGSQIIQPSDSSASFESVQKATVKNVDLSDYDQLDNLMIKRNLSINPSDYDDIVYYRNQDAMKAQEIIIVKFKDNSQQDEFRQAVENRKRDQLNIYKGYEPDSVKLLNKSEIIIHANYALFVVHEDASTIKQQFLGSL